MKTVITKEVLIDYGMKETGDPVVPFKKIISIREEGDDSERGDIAIQVSCYRNTPEFTLCLPDGAMIYLSIGTIGQLKKFEKCIASYEPNY